MLFALAASTTSIAHSTATVLPGPAAGPSFDRAAHAVLTGSAGLIWLQSEWAKPVLAPQSCGWCSTNALDNTVRNHLRWNHPAFADTASNIVAFGGLAVPAVVLVAHLATPGVPPSGIDKPLLVLEATLLAMDVNQTVKYLVGRERPDARSLRLSDPAYARDPDGNLSFFSGHTTAAAALATSSVHVLSNGRASLFSYLGAGAGAAALAGDLRIAADKHYFTDVVSGALFGATTGWLVPELASVAPDSYVMVQRSSTRRQWCSVAVSDRSERGRRVGIRQGGENACFGCSKGFGEPCEHVRSQRPAA